MVLKNKCNLYTNCNICPRECGAKRNDEKIGYCGCTGNILLTRVSLHMWEEPCISGTNGSGTVFFSGCHLKCVFCQNEPAVMLKNSKQVSPERLSDIFFELEQKGAHNINLVTPSHFAPSVAKAINMAKQKNISIPFVYNCGGYEKCETLKMFDGIIDIYLPDFKYMSPSIAKKYSNAADYANVCKNAVNEMLRQTGRFEFDEKELIKHGVIVRHLVLPGYAGDSKRIIKYLHNTYGDNIYISIMGQYTPKCDIYGDGGVFAEKYPELCRTLTQDEYNDVVEFAENEGVKYAYTQFLSSGSKDYVPDFSEQNKQENGVNKIAVKRKT